MAIEILEERDHLEDIAPQAEQEPEVQKMTIDAELSLENKNELISAW